VTRLAYGQTLDGIHLADGRTLRAAVFDEHQVRAAAGITLALGAVAFVHAYFAQAYAPLRAVAAIFVVEFAVRVLLGVHRSPLGMVAGWLVRRGWVQRDEAYEICAGGACAIPPRAPTRAPEGPALRRTHQ
jgi:hypothetical protein